MKFMTNLFIISFIALPVYAGGPAIESNNLKVGMVITRPNQIIMEIDGTINLLTAKAPDENQDQGSGKTVKLVIEKGILRIPKRESSHPGGPEFSVYSDWNQYQEEMKAWEGKDIFIQMWMTELIIRNQFPKEIIARDCKISPKRKMY